MTDIVERLLNACVVHPVYGLTVNLSLRRADCVEAAKEIEQNRLDLEEYRRDVERLRAALEPFADTAARLDAVIYGSDGVTFCHPLNGMNDEECKVWPLLDKQTILEAWRYYGPVSELIGLQMHSFRTARAALNSEKEGK